MDQKNANKNRESVAPRALEYVPLGDLKENPANPKAHRVGLVGSSIGRFGVADVIVRDDRTGLIISGHGRRAALTQMRDSGQSAPDGVLVADNGEWLVPVVTGWASRSDQEASAALVALNRASEVGGWDDESLLMVLSELSLADGGLTGVGYTDSDVEALVRSMAEEGAVEGSAGAMARPEYESDVREMYGVTIVLGSAEEQEAAYERLSAEYEHVRVVTV